MKRVLVAGLVLLLGSLAVITHVSGQRRVGVSLLSRPVRARQMMLRGELPVLPSTSPSPLPARQPDSSFHMPGATIHFDEGENINHREIDCHWRR